MKSIATLGAALALAISVHAQDAVKRPVAIKASVGDVTDNRSTGSFNSECKMELKFMGDAAADASSVRKVRVTKALDELGRDLTRTEDSDSFGSMGSNKRGTTLKADVRLLNPSRNATVIKLIEGEVEFFNPTSANGGVLIIKDFLKHPAEPVQNATLKKHGIELIYLTKESYEAKKKQLEAQKNDEPGAKLGEAFGDLFKGMFGGMMSSGSKNAVMFYVKDPDKRVIEIEIQDTAGKALKRGSSWTSQEMRQIELNSPAPADAQLLIHLATPEAVETFSFKVENIPLP